MRVLTVKKKMQKTQINERKKIFKEKEEEEEERKETKK